MKLASLFAAVCFFGTCVHALADCPELNGFYDCGTFKTEIRQSRKGGVEEYEIKQYQQDPSMPFEQGTYLADGKPYAGTADGRITAFCQKEVLIVQEQASTIPFATEKHYLLDQERLLMQDGTQQNGQFRSDDKHKIFCDRKS